jgi:hypothetical protein
MPAAAVEVAVAVPTVVSDRVALWAYIVWPTPAMVASEDWKSEIAELSVVRAFAVLVAVVVWLVSWVCIPETYWSAIALAVLVGS